MLARVWASTLSPCSFRVFSVVYARESARFFASTCACRRLSSDSCSSASRIIRLMSSSLKPDELVIRMDCSFPVALSFADTCRIPFASMSKLTSICGIPRGAGGIPTRSNWPRSLLSFAMGRSPWNTRMVTAFWLSSAVENTWVFLVGMVVLRSMIFVNTPPKVSIPRDRGVTSSSRTSLTSPPRTPPWMAAPMATTSSGFTPL